MYPISKLVVVALACIGGVVAAPAHVGVIIGYRTVSDVQAAMYKKAGTPVFDKPWGDTQIGEGVYLTAKGAGWPGGTKDSFCAISANPARLSSTKKAWIPETYGGKTLWKKLANIDAYIKSLDKTWDPASVLRLSRILGKETELQLLIPPKLLNQNGGGLGLTVTCTKDEKKMKNMPTIDWLNDSRWRTNVKGRMD
ncbi:hypothetical protein MGYG_06682 [Nannizzia gypsea CBS 118893]|uniref:Uncharacterized protein n=1 Tax=Arthroderma gypseum (strain ATCC MYA-4604 / CBS 118893) TaxID=535722 RepID=E4V0X0_ARTGP|nr:hypothetical protein MGYG_06682 [Nannizzia gypsea CBS 118893]EFR03685.1 hypothetical protein MGYG_06682 [Nannizzia gypsea CBS 118893]